MTKTSTEVVKEFFSAFGKGDLAGLVATFHKDCLIQAVRAGSRGPRQIYGNYHGVEGVKEFLATLSQSFDTQAFTVDQVVGEGEVAFAAGSFTHKVKTSGKLFASDWALRCKVREGKITEYRFFEDSEAFALAN